jgi:hypothetical protein
MRWFHYSFAKYFGRGMADSLTVSELSDLVKWVIRSKIFAPSFTEKEKKYFAHEVLCAYVSEYAKEDAAATEEPTTSDFTL